MTAFKWFPLLASLVASANAFAVSKYTVSLKPSMSGEKLLVAPALSDGTPLEEDANRAVLKLLADKKFLPVTKEGITASNADDSISFGYPFSFAKKASERFRGCVVSWFESLDSIEAINFGAYVYATMDSQPESEWKAYGTKMAEDFLRSTANGSADCVQKAPSRDDTQGILIQVDSYLSMSAAQPKDIKARLTWFGDRVVSTMTADITQKRSADLLAYVRQWIESIRSVSMEPTRTLDFQELWSGKKLSRAELAGRSLFRLVPKDKIDAAAGSKDVSQIYGALLSVDSLLSACSYSDGTTSPSLCIDTGKVFWLDLKTSNGNALFILSK